MRVNRIDHVNIRTPLFEETLDFFEKALGLRRGPAASSRMIRRNVWLYSEDGAALIHVNGLEEDEPWVEAGQASRLHHVALGCAGLAATRARLSSLNIPMNEARLMGRDVTQINITDPNGVLIELLFEEIDE